MNAPGAWRGLALLILVAFYTHADRQLFALQAESIRATFGIGDAQFGLLQGGSVALFVALAGYPLGWLADRIDRRRVYALCLLTWALALAWCAQADSFAELFLASACIGAAEAGLLPLAYALIPEWFGERRRQAANSAYVFLGRLSVGLVIFACGALIHKLDGLQPQLPAPLNAWPTWRLSMLAAALPGLLMLPLLIWLPRGMAPLAPLALPAAPSAPSVPASSAPLLPWLRAHAGACGALGAAFGMLTLGANAVGSFMPALAARQWQASPLLAGQGLGAGALAAALFALLASTCLLRRVEPDQRWSAALNCAAAALGLAALATLALPFAPGLGALYLIYSLGLAGVMTAAMLLPGVMQALAPVRLRARLMALFVGMAVIGSAVGPVWVGALSDAKGGRAADLAMAMALVGAPMLSVAALLLLWARRSGLARMFHKVGPV